MDTLPHTTAAESFVFASSVEDDVWHPKKDAKSYEWWYFDALSDDESEAVVVVFLDNFVYSPRYNSEATGHAAVRFPAVSFTYFSGGRAIYRAVQEFSETEFHSSPSRPECTIGDNWFKLDSAEYGSGYLISIKAKLPGGRRLEATLEWLSIESDLCRASDRPAASAHFWNMVAPRSDVTGRITVLDRKSKISDERHFRGTGYHDHNLDNRWLQKTVRDWHWGRAHFADATAVFYRYCETGDMNPSTKLYVIKNGELTDRSVDYDEQNYARNKFGIRYPTRLRLISQDNVRLRVKPFKIIDASFYYLRFLSEITLTLRDGVPRKTTGITEFLAPKTLKYRWLNWLSDIRTGKNGKPPLLP